MPVISVVPDRFKVQEQALLDSGQGGGPGGKHVRRPVRGIQAKEDSFATLRVVAGNGDAVSIIDAGSNRKHKVNPGDKDEDFFKVGNKRATDVYSNFFIQSVQEERAEKQQILETFGEPFIFLFGERARMVTFSGILLNTFDFNWEGEWWHNYDQYLRGTKCVENDARIFLSFEETLVTGYIIGSSANKNAQERNWVNFQFTMFITGYTNFSNLGSPIADQNAGGSGILGTTRPLFDTSPFRPTLIDTSTPIVSAFLKDGSLGDLSLAEGLVSNISKISATFDSLRGQAEKVIKKLSDLANGTIIRVPVGFAGALEFDENARVDLVDVTGGGVVKYSTFDQNQDEYVGSSGHYGSAVRRNGVVRVDPSQGIELRRDQSMISEAKKLWAQKGFDVPLPDEGAVAGLLVKTGFGLTAVGANAAWSGKLPDPMQTTSAANPIRVSKIPLIGG